MIEKIRFWLMKQCINLALTFADKTKVEGMALLMAIQGWVEYINSPEADKIREKYVVKNKE